jgi:hypothetical protein
MKSMSKFFICTFLFFLSFALFSQSNGISKAYSFDIRKKIEPPILAIEGLRFIDEDGNNAINANENCKIEFKLINTGKGDALNIKALVNAFGNTEGISFLKSQNLSKVDKLGGSQTFLIEINSDFKTTDGNIEFTLEIEEPNGFNSDKIKIEVTSRKFLVPSLKVVDCIVFSGNHASNLELKKPFSVQLLIQNVGQGLAKNAELKFKIPENVFMTSGDEQMQLKDIAPNEKRSIVYELIANNKYMLPNIVISANLTESFNLYGENWTKTLALNQRLAQEKIQIEAKSENKINIETASLRSDVDKDIPSGLPINTKKYALIIGCEDYTKYQTDLDKEVNVDFAANDARVFAEYAEKTLGFPKEHIFTLIDPTKSMVKQNIAKIIKSIEIENGQAEVVFYYSGHGLPDEETKQAFLIPVDVNGSNPKDGISLDWLYTQLNTYPSKKVTVVLDACFSGGARNKELVALKGVKVKPRIDAVPGTILVLSSSKGNESSAVYKEKQHGYFTYFLLKNLKESRGKQEFGTAFEQVKYNVSKEVNIKLNKRQTPDVIPSIIIGENWKTLTW